MGKDENKSGTEHLPFDLSSIQEEYGPIREFEEKCPGVYSLWAGPAERHLTETKFYAIAEVAPISKEARSYGHRFPSCPELLFYNCSSWNFHWNIIAYEILWYRKKNRLPLEEFDDLHTLSTYGMEVCPEYFGTYPVPNITPWGYTTRHKTIHNGVYWIETDQCVSTLAVCYVIQDDFSSAVRNLSTQTEHDIEQGLNETMGYVFFQEDDTCLPLFELVQQNSRWDWSMINQPALMNAVWTRFPEYAAAHNMREQRGGNDGFGMMLRALGIESELRGSLDNMITLTPNAGIHFFTFL